MHKVRRAKKKKTTLVDKKYVICRESCRVEQKRYDKEIPYKQVLNNNPVIMNDISSLGANRLTCDHLLAGHLYLTNFMDYYKSGKNVRKD